MRKLTSLLVGVAAVCMLSLPSRADIINNLGPNPTSGAGAFANTDPGIGGSGNFIDIFNFSLTQGLHLTIAFATNTYADGLSQFISNFTGAVVYEGADGQIGGVGPNADVVVLGPELAQACFAIPQCQIFGGSAFLPQGEYHLRITGNAGVDAGYGGNLSTSLQEVPLPGAVWLFGSILMLVGGVRQWFRRRQRLALA